MNITAASTDIYYPNISGPGRASARTQPPGQAPAILDPSSQSTSPPEAGVPRDSSRIPVPQSQEQTRNQATQTNETAPDGTLLTEEELRLVKELQKVDDDVRQHEMAHVAAGGALVTSGAQFSYATGPDGQRYAIAGEVSIDTSPVPGDPQATMDKMERVRQAALAPSSPSSQDLKVAAQASSAILEATAELTRLTAKQQAAETQSQPPMSAAQAADAYTRVDALPETDNYTFELAV